MGNAVSDASDQRGEQTSSNGDAALIEFIKDECPTLYKAILSSDQHFQNRVLAEFNKASSTGQYFQSIADIKSYMESRRIQRIEKLKSISQQRFARTPAVKLPCIAFRINDRIATAFVDTGCGMSCLTHKASKNLGLDSCIIENVKGLATGFGNETSIVGIIPKVAVHIGELVFQVNFLVIEKASADFIIFGADFIVNHKLKLDFRRGEVVFPRRVQEEKAVRFIPAVASRNINAELIVRMVQKMNVPRTLGFLPDVINQRNVFLSVRINETIVQVMIDSGAEASMISRKTATHLNIFKFADLRIHRVSYGLGPVVIIGRIAPIPIEFDELTCLFIPFEVLNGIEQDLLILGADFLTFYGCQIDFENNRLDIHLDRKRSYTLSEKQADASTIPKFFKDSGLDSLLGFQSPQAKNGERMHSPTVKFDASKDDDEIDVDEIDKSEESDDIDEIDENFKKPKGPKGTKSRLDVDGNGKFKKPKDENGRFAVDGMPTLDLDGPPNFKKPKDKNGRFAVDGMPTLDLDGPPKFKKPKDKNGTFTLDGMPTLEVDGPRKFKKPKDENGRFAVDGMPTFDLDGPRKFKNPKDEKSATPKRLKSKNKKVNYEKKTTTDEYVTVTLESMTSTPLSL